MTHDEASSLELAESSKFRRLSEIVLLASFAWEKRRDVLGCAYLSHGRAVYEWAWAQARYWHNEWTRLMHEANALVASLPVREDFTHRRNS